MAALTALLLVSVAFTSPAVAGGDGGYGGFFIDETYYGYKHSLGNHATGVGGHGGDGTRAPEAGGPGNGALGGDVGGDGARGADSVGLPASGMGGGGGGGGGAGRIVDANATSTGTLTGGKGGEGGTAGGGGGGGGAGALVTRNVALTNSGTITGGAGGTGGADVGAYGKGGGGGGGAGIYATYPVRIINTGTIRGGAGGASAAGAGAGSGYGGRGGIGEGGAVGGSRAGRLTEGGAGIIGGNLTITNSGTISGGLGGDGVTRANAVRFTGGTNRLELQSGSSITGVVDAKFGVADTFALGGGGNSTFNVGGFGFAAIPGQYQGFDRFEKTGTSTWVLTGRTDTTTPWKLIGGKLSIAADDALGLTAGGLTFAGGTLATTAGFDTVRSVTLEGSGTIDVASGTVLSLSGTVSGTGDLTKSGTGRLKLAGTNDYSGATVVGAGVVQAGVENAIAASSGLRLTGGSFELGGFDQRLRGLTGASGTTVTLGATTLTVENTTANRFDGVIAGTGGLTKGGTAVLGLGGVNTYTGATVVADGVLQAGVQNAIGASSGLRLTAGGFDLNGYDQRLKGLNGTAGTSVILGTATLTVENAAANRFDGVISGSGGLTKNGSAIMNLAGTNTYTGSTLVTAGTLQGGVENAIAASSGLLLTGGLFDLGGHDQHLKGFNGSLGTAVDLGSATLTVANETANRFDGAISGTGGLVKTGSATLDMTGINTYSGATVLRDGRLQLNAGGVGGSLASTSYAISGGVLDPNGQTIPTNSTVSMTGGVLALSSGSLEIGDLSGTGGSVLLAPSSILTTGRSDRSTTYAGTIGSDGNGGLRKTGIGTLMLTGENRYADATFVAGGTLQLGDGGTTGSIDATTPVVIDPGAIFAVNRSDTLTLSNAVTGAGEFRHAGAGRTVLTGSNGAGGEFTGLASVGSGTLSVNGVFGDTIGHTARLNVDAGGKLGGTGTVAGSVLAQPGSTIAPGNSIGTLHIAGDLGFASGSAFAVEIQSDGASDRIETAGVATIDSGAGVRVIALDPTVSYLGGQNYTILQAARVDGAFGSVAGLDSAFLTSRLAYTPTTVSLLVEAVPGPPPVTPPVTPPVSPPVTPPVSPPVTPPVLPPVLPPVTPPVLPPVAPPVTPVRFEGVAMTRNQFATASALSTLAQSGESLALYNSILFSNAPDARLAFDQLSGEVHASTQGALIAGSAELRDTVGSRIDDVFQGVAQGSDPAEDEGRYALPGAWIHGHGLFGRADGDGNAGSVERETSGLIVGADRAVTDNSVLGLFAGYGETTIDARSGSSTVNALHVGAYGGMELGSLELSGSASYSRDDISTERQVAFPGFSDRLAADHTAGAAQALGEIGYRLQLGGIDLKPFGNLAYVRLDNDSFRETGGAARLEARDATMETVFSTVGLRLRHDVYAGGYRFAVKGSASWRHASGDLIPSLTNTFVTGLPFTVQGAPISTDVAVMEAGFAADLSDNVSVSASYLGQFGNAGRDNGFRVGLAARF